MHFKWIPKVVHGYKSTQKCKKVAIYKEYKVAPVYVVYWKYINLIWHEEQQNRIPTTVATLRQQQQQ